MKLVKRVFQSPQLESPFLFQLALYSFLFLYILLMEILFWASKPTFISNVPVIDKINIILNCLAILSALSLAMAIPTALIVRLSRKILGNKIAQYVCLVFYSIPFVIFSVINYFYIDRWSYSVFGFSMVSRGTAINLLLFFTFIILGIFLYVFHAENILKGILQKRKLILVFLCILFVVGWGNLCRNSFSVINASEISPLKIDRSSEKPPNVIILTYDMFTLRLTPFLGYKWNTTPNLLERKKEFYVFSRATAIARDSRGGISALLTGRSPYATHVFGGQDRLTGEDRFVHFMAMLMSMGYYTVNYAEDMWSDPKNFNMLNGFCEINGNRIDPIDIKLQQLGNKTRSIKNASMSNAPVFDYIPFIERFRQKFIVDFPILTNVLNDVYEDYMLSLAYTLRIRDRLKYRRLRALVIPQKIDEEVVIHKNVHKELIVCKNHTHSKFLSRLEKLLQDDVYPFFFHCHNTVTHNPVSKKSLTIRKFSVGSDYFDNLYADALLTMDFEVNEVIELLEKYGQYDNTLFILTTDHEYNWTGKGEGTSLLMHFPGQTDGRIIHERIWLLDIAPTIADYLGIYSVSWMNGESLLPLINGEKDAASRFENRFIHVAQGRQALTVVKGNYSLYKCIKPGKEETVVRYLRPKGKGSVVLNPIEIATHQREIKSFEQEFQRICDSSRFD